MSSQPGETVPDPPPQPVPDPDSAGFWQATAAGRLELRRCQTCGIWCHPPLECCRRCGEPTRWEPVSGEGSLYSFIVVHQPAVPGFTGMLPYVLGLVELDEQPGLRLVTRLEGADADRLQAGQRMRVRIVDHPGGQFRIPVFHPLAAQQPGAARP
jgi:uncharacterized protein